MFLVEQHVQTVTVRPKMDSQAPLSDHLATAAAITSSTQRQAIAEPEAMEQLEDGAQRIVAAYVAIKRRIQRSMLNRNEEEKVQGILDRYEKIMEDASTIEAELNDILSLPPNVNFQPQNRS